VGKKITLSATIEQVIQRIGSSVRRSMLFVLCFALFILCPHIAHSAPPLWTQSQQLFSGSAYSSEADVCSRDDEVYVVWSDNRTGNREIFFIFSTNAGQTWSNVERLTDTPGDSAQPAVACDRKNLYLVWREKSEDALQDTVSHIYYKKWDGATWSDDLLISEGYENSSRPDIASTTLFPDSHLYIVWDSTADNRTTAHLIRSNDGGQSFSTPQPLTSGSWSTMEPAIWCGARDAYIAWADDREGDWNIFFRRWGEVQAGQETRLSVVTDCRSPAVRGAEPEIHIAWQCVEKDSVYADIHVSSSVNYGATWSVERKLTDGEAESVSPKIAVSDDEAWFFWQDGRSGEWQTFYWILDDADQGQQLTDSGKPTILPDAVSTPGQIHIFWTNIESDSRANIMYMRRDTIAPSPPGTPSHFDLTAVSEYDDDDQITFTWKSAADTTRRFPIEEGVKEYNVYYQVDDEEFAFIKSVNSASYDVPGESGRTYRIYVEAVDEVGNVSAPSGISPRVTCDPDAPEVLLHSPSSNSVMRGAIPIIISVHDPDLLEYKIEYGSSAAPSVWWLLAGPLQEELDRERILTWETSELDGIYTLRVTAQDKAGNKTDVEALVNIDSRPPMDISPGETESMTELDVQWIYGAPAWSPGGERIAFHSDEGGTEDIWVMAADGTGRTRLTRSTAVEHNPAWSYNGDMIAFQSLTNDGNWDIWVMKSNGKNLKQITSDESMDTNPVWSPDGYSLAFDSDRDGDSEIWMITNVQSVVTGAAPQFFQLTDNNWEDSHPTWSPDGSRIIFQSSRRGNWDLFEMGIDETVPILIVDTPADEIEPSWSPDRKRVLFSTNEPGDHYEIRAINWPEASEQVQLSPRGEDARRASWSPAMDSIVYEHDGSLYTAELVYPIGLLEAIISWPGGGEVLSGSIDVEGIARGENFWGYKLQYSQIGADLTDEPFQIGGESSSPLPETGFLGRWNTEELEGEYLLTLVVIGKDGSYVEDSVRVLIANNLPFILVNEPEDGLVTNESVITVSGRTEPRASVTLNNDAVPLNPDGSFSQKIQLSDGANNITIKAQSPSLWNGEYMVKRTVIRDVKPPVINIDSPKDFQVINVPYVTVSGSVDEQAEVSILSKRVWLDGSNRFQRKILCSEGTNLITVSASDELGHYESETRRVIFQRDTEVISDISAPAIADVFPDNRTVITGKNARITATLIDDTGLDPLTIAFTFDDEEIDGEEYDLDIKMPDAEEDFPLDQYPLVHFTYSLPPMVSEGDHSFRLDVEDTSGNAGGATFDFSIDTVPSSAMVSAILTDTNQIKVIATANKPLVQISGGTVYNDSGGWDSLSSSGYSLSSFVWEDDHYETSLKISPSQRSLVINFAARTYLGKEVSAQGYMAWSKARAGECVCLGVEGGPQFSSDPVSDRIGELVLVLRSYDGIDTNLLSLQQANAEYRRLRPSGLVYILEASREVEEGEIQGILSLPALEQRLAMFQWDNDLGEWQPLERIGATANSLESHIVSPGIYALLADIEPPVIKDVSPTDAGEVPLDRFFVEANISDRGSGISQIKLMIDGNQVDFDYDPVEGWLTYFPSMLEWGLHKLEIAATDRAGNVAEFSTSFMTQEIFKFVKVLVYPNPARGDVNIEYKLTRLADVTLKIYTITGELVYRSEKKDVAAGTFIWKGKNSAGNKVASGIYIYSIQALLYGTKIHEQGAIALVM